MGIELFAHLQNLRNQGVASTQLSFAEKDASKGKVVPPPALLAAAPVDASSQGWSGRWRRRGWLLGRGRESSSARTTVW